MHQQGMGLVNLLVSLALSASLLTMLFQLWQQSQQLQHTQHMRLQIQEDAQLILQSLMQELRLSGFSANSEVAAASVDDCPTSKQWIMQLEQAVDTQADISNSVFGVALENCLDLSVRQGSDILFIRRLSAQPQQAQGFVKSWYLLKKAQANESRYVFLERWPTDLLTADDSLWRVESKLFYVRDYSVRGDNTPSLVMATANATGFDQQVLAENVEALQLQWLIKQAENSFILQHRPNANELAQAVLLRLHLLMRGSKQTEQETVQTAYQLATSYSPEQLEYNYYYFSGSAFLRNRQ